MRSDRNLSLPGCWAMLTLRPDRTSWLWTRKISGLSPVTVGTSAAISCGRTVGTTIEVTEAVAGDIAVDRFSFTDEI